MQSYSQQIDATLRMEDLPRLGSKLALPSGWTYRTRLLELELDLDAGGLATILQDNLENTYQCARGCDE